MTAHNVTILLARDQQVSQKIPNTWQRLMKLAEVIEEDAMSFAQNLFKLLGFTVTEPLPLAAIYALAEGLKAKEGFWLRADPIELQVDLSQAYFLGSEHLSLEHSEACELMAELNDFLKDEGLKLQIGSNPNHWYLRLNDHPQINTYSPQQVYGKNILSFFPYGPNEAYWRSLLTSLQMILYNSKVNNRRTAQRRPSIGSLWFWGGGFSPQSAVAVNWHRVISNDLLAIELAKLARIPSVMPIKSMDWNSLLAATDDCLLVLDESIDIYDALTSLFKPVKAMLRQGKIHNLVIALPGKSYHVKWQDLNFWQRWLL